MAEIDDLELNRIYARLDYLEQLAESAPRVPAIGGVDGGDLAGDTIPEIVDETGSAGESALLRRDDNVPALKVRRNTDTPTKNISALHAASDSEGWQLAIAAAADEDAERAASAHANPTLEVVPDGGAQVKLDTYGSGKQQLVPGASGIYGKLNPAGGVVDIGDGAELKVGDGVEVGIANDVKVKPDADADNILAVSASGVLVKALASTSKRGLMLQASAPAAGLRNIPAIDNAETVWKVAALFDATNPANLGTASPGTAMTAARRDHVHNTPSSSPDVETDTLASDYTMSTSGWEDVLSLTAPGSGALVWANFGASLSPVSARITYDSGGGDTPCADVGPGSGRSGTGFAIVPGGATIKLQISDGGSGYTIYAAETFLAAMAF